jgi:hypothetical protein
LIKRPVLFNDFFSKPYLETIEELNKDAEIRYVEVG